VRGAVRYEFGKAQLLLLGKLSGQKMKETFKKFDTSGDGTLDAFELKVMFMCVNIRICICDICIYLYIYIHICIYMYLNIICVG